MGSKSPHSVLLQLPTSIQDGADLLQPQTQPHLIPSATIWRGANAESWISQGRQDTTVSEVQLPYVPVMPPSEGSPWSALTPGEGGGKHSEKVRVGQGRP